MRDQLQRSQQLAEQLQEQLRDQVSGGQQSTQAGKRDLAVIDSKSVVPEGESEQRAGMGGAVNTDGNNLPWGMPVRSGNNLPSRTSKISSISRSCFVSCSSRLSSSKARCALKPNSTTSTTSCTRLLMKRCLRSIGTWFRNTIVYCQKVRGLTA